MKEEIKKKVLEDLFVGHNVYIVYNGIKDMRIRAASATVISIKSINGKDVLVELNVDTDYGRKLETAIFNFQDSSCVIKSDSNEAIYCFINKDDAINEVEELKNQRLSYLSANKPKDWKELEHTVLFDQIVCVSRIEGRK